MAKKQEVPDTGWLRCPLCGRGEIRYMKLKEAYWCLRCGAEFVADWKKKEVALRRKV